jgi:phosphatidate cytidylyltransferase
MNKTRILTGITLALIIVLSFLSLSLNAITLLIGFIVSLSVWEFYKLRFSSEIAIAISVVLFFGLIYLDFGQELKFTLSSIGLLAWLGIGFLILGFPHNKNILQNKYFWVLSGFFIHIPFWTSIFLILNHEGYFLGNIGLELTSEYVVILLITISALTDVLAYFGGKKYGKRKFLSNISPNKTLEGFLIALIGTPLLVMPLLALVFDLNFIKFFILIFLVSIFSVLGDASASLFKRIAGVKDSSNLLPGHGGILDRIDSHLAAAPCFVVLVYLMRLGS